jgi:hypothetical protein
MLINLLTTRNGSLTHCSAEPSITIIRHTIKISVDKKEKKKHEEEKGIGKAKKILNGH